MGSTHMARGAGLSPQRSHQQLDPKSPPTCRTAGPQVPFQASSSISWDIPSMLFHNAPSAHPWVSDSGCHRLLQAMVPPACNLLGCCLCQHHQYTPETHDHCLRGCFHTSPAKAHPTGTARGCQDALCSSGSPLLSGHPWIPLFQRVPQQDCLPPWC